MKTTTSSSKVSINKSKKPKVKKKGVKRSSVATELSQEYVKYFAVPTTTPAVFQILTMYDYLVPFQTTNRT